MYAVIRTGGKQHRVTEGELVSVEKLEAEEGRIVDFDQVLLIEDGEDIHVGTPVLAGAVVRAEVVENYKDKKVIVFKKKRRKGYKKTRGHRQLLTKVRVQRIISDISLLSEEERAASVRAVESVDATVPAAPAKTRKTPAAAAKKTKPALKKAPESVSAKKPAREAAEKKPVKPRAVKAAPKPKKKAQE